MRTSGFGDSGCTPTSGVSPITPRMVSWRMTRPGRRPASAPRHRGQDGDDVAVAQLGVELIEVTDVVVVAVHVDELVQPALIVDELAGEPRIPGSEVAEHLAHRRAVGCDRRRAVDVRAQQGGKSYCDGHDLILQVRPSGSGLTAAAARAWTTSPHHASRRRRAAEAARVAPG